MSVVVLLAALGLATPTLQARSSGAERAKAAPEAPRASPGGQQPDRIAEAYDQFLLAQRFEDDGDVDQSIAAYKRAIGLDPASADLLAALGGVYLKASRTDEAVQSAEQALKIEASNREAHRILGVVYASLATADASRNSQATQRQNLDKAIQHLEQAVDMPVGDADVNVRAMLARLYVGIRNYDKAIPLLVDLVKQEPQWQDGAALLAAAYADSGRSAEAINWLEEAVDDNPQLYPTLADFYGRERRWRDAAATYEKALVVVPRSFDLRVRYGQALLSEGGFDNAVKARGVLREALANRANDERAMYLLSQAERLAGDLDAAEAIARRLITVNNKSPRAYVALAEALEDRQRYQAVADSLAPAVAQFRSARGSELTLPVLLPHLGFAYQQIGQADKAISVFEEARKLSPDDVSVVTYLIQAQLAGKKYAAAEELAHATRASHPDDVRLAKLEAQALRQSGKVDQGVAILSDFVQKPNATAAAFVALAQYYSDANRGAQAVKVLQDAQMKFPADAVVTFELGAIFEKQKRYAESEAAFRKVLEHDPENAPALNYLGYMLAERGERLDESVDFVQRALRIEPENGSFLDSLGWAYYKSGRMDLALDNLRRAADRLEANSVIQDHYGDVLFKVGRYDDAIAAWTRALGGDGDSVDRPEIEKKIRSAKQKLPRK
jgi:tetratricopeptide (TPR) repeat protein